MDAAAFLASGGDAAGAASADAAWHECRTPTHGYEATREAVMAVSGARLIGKAPGDTPGALASQREAARVPRGRSQTANVGLVPGKS
jgi:hypothetical protein